MSRHVFNIYVPRYVDLEGYYTIPFAARDSKSAKRSHLFQDFPDPEHGTAYYRSKWIGGMLGMVLDYYKSL